jgi:hypothetical protein
MEPEVLELEQDLEDDVEAEDWDEEDLGLDWNEADARSVVREVVSLEDFD